MVGLPCASCGCVCCNKTWFNSGVMSMLTEGRVGHLSMDEGEGLGIVVCTVGTV